MLKPIIPNRRIHPHLCHYQKELRRKLTPAERKMAAILRSMRVEFVEQQVFLEASTEKAYIVDLWLPGHRIVVECDGWHHYTRLGKALDKARDKCFRNAHIRVIRLPNGRVFKLRKESLAGLLNL